MVLITSWLSYLSPVLVGGVAGLLYGYSFLLQQRRAFGGDHSLSGRLSKVGFFLFRIVILFYAVKYLLRSELIPSILGIIVFMVIFWLIILRVKVFPYEWNWPNRG